MKKILQLIKGFFLSSYKRTIAVMIVLSFSVAGYLLVNETFLKVRAANIQIAEENYGKWHFRCKYVSHDDYRYISAEPSILELGAEWVIGTTDTNLLLLYRDDTYNNLDNTKFSLQSGVLPQRIDEAAVTQNYAEENGIGIGDTVTFSYEKVDYSSGKILFTDSGTFRITGILGNYDMDETMSIGFVSKELKDRYEERIDVENMYGILKSSANIDGTVRVLFENKQSPSGIQLNNQIIFAQEDNTVYKFINFMVDVFLWLISALLIYSVLYYMLMDQKRSLSILRSIGFENKELKKCIYIEVLILLLISIPIGIITGYILNEILYNKLISMILSGSESYTYVFDSHMSVSVVLQGVLMVVLSVIPAILLPLKEFGKLTPIELRSGGTDTELSESKGIRFLLKASSNKMYTFGVRSLIRNKRRTVLTVAITFLSLMVVSIILWMNSFELDDGEWLRVYVPEDVRVTVKEQTGRYINKETIRRIEEIDGVEKVSAYYVGEIWISVPVADINKESAMYKRFSAEMREANVYCDEENIERFCFNITAIACEDVEQYLQNAEYGKNDIVIGEDLSEFLLNTANVQLFQFDVEDENRGRTNVVKVRIGSVIDRFWFMPEEGIGVTRIIVDKDLIAPLIDADGFTRLDIKLYDPDDIATVMMIKKMDGLEDFCSVSLLKDRVKNYKAQAQEQIKIQLFFVLIFIFIAVINSFNTIINNIMHRLPEFRQMNIIGFTKAEIFTAAAWENMFFSIISVFFAGVCQIVMLTLNHVFKWGLYARAGEFVVLDILMILINFVLIIYGFYISERLDAKSSVIGYI